MTLLHQNEHFIDIDFIIEVHRHKTRQSFHLSNSNSPFLHAVAERMQKVNYYKEMQKSILDESTRLHKFILEQGKTAQRKIFVFASAYKNEGVSGVVLNLAKVFEIARQHRVLVIDGNIKTPGLTRFMGGMGLGPGLLDLLAEETNSRDLLQKLAGSQIYFLNHGRKRKRARELIQYSLLQKRLKKLIPLFDYILIAVPPLELYHDGYVWGRIADGMILVVHAYETPLKAIRNIKNKVAQLRIPLLGTILNRRNFSVPKFVYEWL